MANILHWYDNSEGEQIIIEGYGLRLLNLVQAKGNYEKRKRFERAKDGRTTVRTLKEILANNSFNIFDGFVHAVGNSHSMLNANFPYNLAGENCAILAAAFLSDGHNSSDHPHYSNKEMFLKEKIQNVANSIIPGISYEYRRISIRFHPILSRVLLKLEVPLGNKADKNSDMPEFIRRNRKLWKPYLVQVFDDEGHAPTRDSRKIILGRTVHIQVSNIMLDELVMRKKVYHNSLTKEMIDAAESRKPKLLFREAELLNKLGIDCKIRLRTIAKYPKWVSADWVIEIACNANIKKFHEKVGFSLPRKIKQIEEYLMGCSVWSLRRGS